MKRYTLTYFDSTRNERLRYLNGASWTDVENVEKEYRRWLKEEYRRNNQGFFSNRSKWAIMGTDTITKKTVLIKRL